MGELSSSECIDHSRTKARHPQTNGSCERFHRTLNYALASRKQLYHSLAALQQDLDQLVECYNQPRPHRGRYGYGKTPWQTFTESKKLALAKQLERQHEPFSGLLAGSQSAVSSLSLSD